MSGSNILQRLTRQENDEMTIELDEFMMILLVSVSVNVSLAVSVIVSVFWCIDEGDVFVYSCCCCCYLLLLLWS